MEKDNSVRRKLKAIFNKTEADFPSAFEHKNYEEMVEDLIFRLVNGIDTEEANRAIEEYKAANQRNIALNQYKRTEELRAELGIIDSEREQQASRLQQFQVGIFAAGCVFNMGLLLFCSQNSFRSDQEQRREAKRHINDIMLGVSGSMNCVWNIVDLFCLFNHRKVTSL